MLCPICKDELVVTGQERLETLSEHVSNPNGIPSLKDKYECVYDYCPAKGNLMWDSWGALYSDSDFSPRYLKFIDDNDGPFESSQRKCNVEIHKKDENHHLFNKEFKWGYIEVKYLYKSNEDGEILSRKRSYVIWKKEGSHFIWYTPGVNMLLHCIKSFHHELKWKKPEKIEFRSSWDKRWWKRAANWYSRMFMRIFHPKTWKAIKA